MYGVQEKAGREVGPRSGSGYRRQKVQIKKQGH